MKKRLPDKYNKQIPKEVWSVFKKFTDEGYEIYLVGAGVRSLLQNKVPVDCDFTTNAVPKIIQTLFKDSFYDNKFGTVGISFKTKRGDELYEITTYRTEWGYSDKRRPDEVKWGKKLEEDLKRRDFTFNAIVIGPILKIGQWDKKSLELIDLFDGQKDFKKKIVRAVGKPNERFSEDALRMMRAVRFAAQLGFTIEKKTFVAIKKNANLIDKISKERIRDELFKILVSNHVADGYVIFRNSGLAEKILPEVEKMFGVEQKSPGRHHLDDVGTHAVKSLKASQSKDPIVNLAILIHDVGKPIVVGKDKKGTITFYNHEVVGASIARNIARRLRFSKKDEKRLVTLVRWHQFSVDERQTDKAFRRFIKNVGKENLTDILEARRADRVGGGARETSWRFERFKKKLVDSGPMVGRVLNQLFEEVVGDKKKNERKYLLKRIKVVGKKL
jgi:tRNA nucleotidyltransferase/poly(A) polymerase